MESVFLNLLNMSITAGWIILAVVALRFLLKRAPKALLMILWAFVGIRLLIPVSIESVLSLIPSAETVPQSVLTAEVPKIDSGIGVVNEIINPILPRGASPALPGSAAPAVPQGGANEAAAQIAGMSANPLAVITKIAAVVWLLGMVALFFYAAMSFLKLKSRVEESIRISENVYICDHVDSPFVLGLIHPKIFLPSDLSQEDYTFAIAHERAHIRRRDQIFKPLGFLLLAVYWFNPLMWVAYILFCRDIEFACDERVLLELGTEAKKSYSQALIDCSIPRRMIAACPLAFGEVDVKNRVKSVLNYRKPKFWILIGTVAVCIAAGVFFLTNPVKALAPEPVEFNAMEDDTEEIYSVNKNLPSGYTLRLPYVEYPTYDEWREYARNRDDHTVHEIEVFKGEKLVFTVDFYNRRANYKEQLEYWKNMSETEPASGSDIVKLIKENNTDDLNYALFYIEQPNVPDPFYANYCRIIGDFPKSQNTAFDIRSYTTSEEAQMLFDALELKYLHGKDAGASSGGTENNESAISEELIVGGRAIFFEGGIKSFISIHAPLPEGYTIRNNFDLEHQEESFKREEKGEDVPIFEILKDGEPVVSVTPYQANPVKASRSELMTSIYSGEGDYLDDQAREDGAGFLYDYVYENTYIIDFPFFSKGSESSLHLSTVYDKEEAERFFEILDFRCEAKDGNPLWEAKERKRASGSSEPINSGSEQSFAENGGSQQEYPIIDGRMMLQEGNEIIITVQAALPEGYTLRRSYAPENQKETQDRLTRREEVGAYEILKEGQPVVYINPYSSDDPDYPCSLIAYFQAEMKAGRSPKDVGYLEDTTLGDGTRRIFYYVEENNGKTTYKYDLNFSQTEECSIELWTINDRGEAERFFELLDFRCEEKAGNPLVPEPAPEPEPQPEPVIEWTEPDRHADSFDYSDPSNGEDTSVIHIEYEVPEGYEVTFPMLWMTYDNPRFGERMNNPTSDDEALKLPKPIEILKDGKTVCGMAFFSKPRYYEVTMPIYQLSNIPRQELLDRYYDDVEQFEREDGTFLTGKEWDIIKGEETVRSVFGGIDLSGSKKLAVVIYVSASASTADVKEYASWFKFGPIQDTEREVSGFLRRMDDPLPVFGRETLESEAGSVLASYFTFDGFDISCPRSSDPAAANDLEITKNGELVYAARIISKEEMQTLKSQYEADPGMTSTDAFGTNNERLKLVGKQEYDYAVTGEAHHYFSLIDFIKSDTAALLIESYTTADGSWENCFFPFFTYTLLPLEE